MEFKRGDYVTHNVLAKSTYPILVHSVKTDHNGTWLLHYNPGVLKPDRWRADLCSLFTPPVNEYKINDLIVNTGYGKNEKGIWRRFAHVDAMEFRRGEWSYGVACPVERVRVWWSESVCQLKAIKEPRRLEFEIDMGALEWTKVGKKQNEPATDFFEWIDPYVRAMDRAYVNTMKARITEINERMFFTIDVKPFDG